MKPLLMLKKSPGGFALPTVILSSVILLIVLVTAITAVGSVSTSLAGQYYNQLAREAAESGLARATACLRASNYTPTWSSGSPLKPNTDCNGTAIGGASQWIVDANNIRTSFTIGLPDVGAAGYVRVSATASVDLIRTSNSAVWRTFTYTAAENSRYNDTPQIASGAGFQSAGHNGYMLAGNGVLYGWGDNTYQQLGPSSLGTIVSTPITIALPDGVSKGKRVFNSGHGATVLCILATHNTLNDQVFCRGAGLNGLVSSDWQRFPLAGGLTALDMVLHGYGGYDGICVKASDLQAYCSGDNSNGALGIANTTQPVAFSDPRKFRLDLANPGPVSGSAASLTVKEVFMQDRFTCVIASDDQAYCAGDNYSGHLGHGNTTVNMGGGNNTPGRAQIPGNPAVVDIRFPYHGGADGVFFQTVNGDMFMSGNNIQGTANDWPSYPPPLAVYPTPRQLTSGAFSLLISLGQDDDNEHGICAIATTPSGNSGLWCMGNANWHGQFGDGTCNSRASWGASTANLGGNVASINQNLEARYQFNSLMVITDSGDVYAAGDNTYGKLGRGTTGSSCASGSSFARVQLPAGVKATAIANGDEYTAYILGDNGRVYAMGRNHNGQIGDGTTTNRNTPVEVKIPRQEIVY